MNKVRYLDKAFVDALRHDHLVSVDGRQITAQEALRASGFTDTEIERMKKNG